MTNPLMTKLEAIMKVEPDPVAQKEILNCLKARLGQPYSVFRPRDLLKRFTRVYGRVSQHANGLGCTIGWTFRASYGNSERNARLLLMALEELSCPFVVTTHASPPHTKTINRRDGNGKPRTRTVRSVRVSIAGGLAAAAWVRKTMRGGCGNERKDQLLQQAAIRAKQIDAIVVQSEAGLIPPETETVVSALERDGVFCDGTGNQAEFHYAP
jgi:hypothetical protein